MTLAAGPIGTPKFEHCADEIPKTPLWQLRGNRSNMKITQNNRK